MSITGNDILNVISERFLVDIDPHFSYSDLNPVKKDALNRYVLAHIDHDFACEIVPGSAECPELVNLFVTNPLFYMDKLRTLIARYYSDNYEVMIETEATIRANLNTAILKIQLDNDMWEFYRNVVYAAMEYLQAFISDSIYDALPDYLEAQNRMAKDAMYEERLRRFKVVGGMQ